MRVEEGGSQFREVAPQAHGSPAPTASRCQDVKHHHHEELQRGEDGARPLRSPSVPTGGTRRDRRERLGAVFPLAVM